MVHRPMSASGKRKVEQQKKKKKKKKKMIEEKEGESESESEKAHGVMAVIDSTWRERLVEDLVLNNGNLELIDGLHCALTIDE